MSSSTWGDFGDRERVVDVGIRRKRWDSLSRRAVCGVITGWLARWRWGIGAGAWQWASEAVSRRGRAVGTDAVARDPESMGRAGRMGAAIQPLGRTWTTGSEDRGVDARDLDGRTAVDRLRRRVRAGTGTPPEQPHPPQTVAPGRRALRRDDRCRAGNRSATGVPAGRSGCRAAFSPFDFLFETSNFVSTSVGTRASTLLIIRSWRKGTLAWVQPESGRRAWAFLRRNPDYRAGWAEAAARPVFEAAPFPVRIQSQADRKALGVGRAGLGKSSWARRQSVLAVLGRGADARRRMGGGAAEAAGIPGKVGAPGSRG